MLLFFLISHAKYIKLNQQPLMSVKKVRISLPME